VSNVDLKFHSIMLVDDNEIDNLINQKMIESANICNRIFVHTGAKSAIEFLRNMEKLAEDKLENFLPDYIFLDIDMPLMDGFQFLDEYDKLKDSTKNYCKVVMLTSSLNPMDMKKAKESKYIVNYLNKPLTQENLKKL
jgi:CheY-like chemotaxis protein